MANDPAATIKQGIKAPAPDICGGWNIRNKSGNAELSALIPIANLYAIMSYDEMADLVRWMQSDDPTQGVGRLHGRKRLVTYVNTEGEDTSSWNSPEVGSDEFNEKIAAIQRQLKKDLIFATVTGQKGSGEPVEVGLVRLAEMNSVMKGAYNQDKPYGGVGINSLNGETANQGNLGRRTTISITMSDPNILDLNYAYQKLMTLNTKYIITYGWSNAAGIDSKLGEEAENFAPYPLVETVPQDDGKVRREIEIDLSSTNTGGFWTAQKMALTKFDFNFNEVGQLEGNFTFFDEVAALLSSFTVADVADAANTILSSGETTDSAGFSNNGVIGEFIGDQLASEIEETQESIFRGNQQFFSPEVDANGNMIVLADPQQNVDEETENDSGSVFGGTAANKEQVLSSEQAMLENIENFKNNSFPRSGPGIIQYDIDQAPIVFDTIIDEPEDPSGNVEVQQIRNVKEVNSRISFYYLGWVLESIRYGMGQQSSAPTRDDYVDNEQSDEEFGLNFYYEPLPENSLFGLQYQRLIESVSVGTIPETVAKIMTFIDEKAFPKYNPRITWEGWGSSSSGWGALRSYIGWNPVGDLIGAYIQKEFGNQARGFDPSSFINQPTFNAAWPAGMVLSSAMQKDMHVEFMARGRTWADEWQNKTPGKNGIGFDSVRFENMSFRDFRNQTNRTRTDEGNVSNTRYTIGDMWDMVGNTNTINWVNPWNEFKTTKDDAGPKKTTVEDTYGGPYNLNLGDDTELGIAIFIRGDIASCAWLDFNTGATAGPNSGTGIAAEFAAGAGGIGYHFNDTYDKLIAAMWIPWKEIEQYRRSSAQFEFRVPGPYGMKIDFLRWILSPQLFQSTMKKWYLEYKKVFMKEIEGVVSRRLNGLKAQGRTYWDILHEPIDILWLTSNRIHQVYEDIAIPNRPPALLMTATGLENFNYSSGAPFPDYDRNWQHSAVDGGLPQDWRLRTRDYEKRFDYSLYSYFPGVRRSPKNWSPYRKEIPEEYEGHENGNLPSMNMLKLLWRRRRMNGVKWPRNYVPGPGGMIYDNVTKRAFWPSCQAGRSFDDQDIAYVPSSGVLSDQQEELLKIFNVNFEHDPENRNILEILFPGYAYKANIVAPSEDRAEEIANAQAVKKQIKDLQENIGKRSLLSYLVYRMINPTPTADESVLPLASQSDISNKIVAMNKILIIKEIMAIFNSNNMPWGSSVSIEGRVVNNHGKLTTSGYRATFEHRGYGETNTWEGTDRHTRKIKLRGSEYVEVPLDWTADRWGEGAESWWNELISNENFIELRDGAWAARSEAQRQYMMQLQNNPNSQLNNYQTGVGEIEIRAAMYDLFMQGFTFGDDQTGAKRRLQGPLIDELLSLINIVELTEIPYNSLALWYAFTHDFTAGVKTEAQIRDIYTDEQGTLTVDNIDEILGLHGMSDAANKPRSMRIIKDSRALVDGKVIPIVMVPRIRETRYSEGTAAEGTAAGDRIPGGDDRPVDVERDSASYDQFGNLFTSNVYIGDEYQGLVENLDLKLWWQNQRDDYGSIFDVSQGPALTAQAAKNFLDAAMQNNANDQYGIDEFFVTFAELRHALYPVLQQFDDRGGTSGGIGNLLAHTQGFRGGSRSTGGGLWHEAPINIFINFFRWVLHKNIDDMNLIKELQSQIAPPMVYGEPQDTSTKRLAMGIISDYFARYRGSNLSYVSDSTLGPYSKENLPPVYFAQVSEMEAEGYVWKTVGIKPTAAEIDNIHNAEGGPAERFKVLYYNFPAGRRLDPNEITYFQNGAQGDPNETDFSDLVSAQEDHYPMRHGHIYLHENVCDPGLTEDERAAMVWDVTSSRMEIQNDRYPGGYQTAFARALQMVSLGMNLWPTQLEGGQLDGHRLSKMIPLDDEEVPLTPGNLGGNVNSSFRFNDYSTSWGARVNHLTPDDIITAKQLIQDEPHHAMASTTSLLGLEYVNDDGKGLLHESMSTPGNAPWRRGLRSEFTGDGYGYQVTFYRGKPFGQVISWGDIFKSVGMNMIGWYGGAVTGGMLGGGSLGNRIIGGAVGSSMIDGTNYPDNIVPGGASNHSGGWVMPPGGADTRSGVREASYGPTAVRDVGLGTGSHKEQRLNSVWKWVSSIQGMGHLSSSIEGFEKLLIEKGLENKPADYITGGLGKERGQAGQVINPVEGRNYTKYATNQVFGDVFPGGTRINRKYTSYLLSIMNLAEHNRRILINKRDAVSYSEPEGKHEGRKVWDISRQDPTYGDAIGYGQSGKTYGDIGDKVPTSTAEIALRRDVVDNMLRPSNHRMNLLEFITQLTAPTTIASVGGQAAVACRNINGVLAVTALGVDQDGWSEDYAHDVIQAFEEGPNFDDYFLDEEVLTEANKRRRIGGQEVLHRNEAFYVYYKKQFSLVESINLTAKVDPAMMWANKDSTKWFEGGLNRNFGKFLGWGNVAEEFKRFVARHTIGTGKTYAGEDRVEKPPLGAHYENLITNNDEDIQVDLQLLEKTPNTFIDAFLKKNATMQSNLMKFYLAEHASDVTSIYKHYMQRVNITIHGTCNIQGYQKLYLKDLLPGLEGLFQVIKVNQSITPGGFSTSMELAMTWQRPPEETTEEKTEEEGQWDASEDERAQTSEQPAS